MNKLKLFITLEGGEGTGKSTVSSLLKDKFELNGYSAYTTRELLYRLANEDRLLMMDKRKALVGVKY